MVDQQSLIGISHLVKKYGTKTAVDNISFDVHGGEIFGFLGPNGAGKTTTLKILVGLLQPTSGAVKVGGFDVQEQPLQAKAICGFVPDVDVYVRYLRKKLELPGEKKLIHTVRGVGYVLRDPAQ